MWLVLLLQSAFAQEGHGLSARVDLVRTGDAEVDAIVRRFSGQVRYCQDQNLRRHPDSAGRLTVSFGIVEGRPQEVRVDANLLGNDEVAECVRLKVARWTFPSLERERVSVAFDLGGDRVGAPQGVRAAATPAPLEGGLKGADPQVTEVVRANQPALDACAVAERAAGRSAQGRLDLGWAVRDGRVTTSWVVLDTTGRPELRACMQAAIAQWTFPDGVRDPVIYTFEFGDPPSTK